MSLDKLAVIFVIIILPISIVLSSYTSAQADTLRLQDSYDIKLYNATYDAVKAYQINSFNEDSSDLANSRQRLIKASANAFFNSLADNFSMSGYTKEEIQIYVPALVFTLYDGYYIYSKYTNEITDDDYATPAEVQAHNAAAPSPAEYITKESTYQNGQELYGVKPFIHYSSRYKDTSKGIDVVISYTLDNFITIQGIVDGNPISDCGYLIDPNKVVVDETNKTVVYDGYSIKPEELVEYVGVTPYKYHKVNGKKYYLDEHYKEPGSDTEIPKWFYLLNGVKNYTEDKFDENDCSDYSAYYYYKEAKEFTERVLNTYNLRDLYSSNAVGERYMNLKIFESTDIEKPGSNFNNHRLEVIKKSIETNLPIAIANYNAYTSGTEIASYDFQMPVLNEGEWEKILNNVAVISFMQGLPIGFKIYDGCTVIPNNKNYEVITEESLYIAKGLLKDMDKNNLTFYYKPTAQDFAGSLIGPTDNLCGILNVDLERRYYYDESGTSVVGDYYYPKFYLADYKSIVGSSGDENLEKISDSTGTEIYKNRIYDYFKNGSSMNPNIKKVAEAYFTALGRERYSMYHTTRNSDIIKDKYKP